MNIKIDNVVKINLTFRKNCYNEKLKILSIFFNAFFNAKISFKNFIDEIKKIMIKNLIKFKFFFNFVNLYFIFNYINQNFRNE